MSKLTEYNPFDHLLAEDELSEYLTDAYEDDDPAVFVVALGHAIKHKGVAQVAEAAGLNRESLYKGNRSVVPVFRTRSSGTTERLPTRSWRAFAGGWSPWSGAGPINDATLSSARPARFG